MFLFELGLTLAGLYSTLESNSVICCFMHVILLIHSHLFAQLWGLAVPKLRFIHRFDGCTVTHPKECGQWKVMCGCVRMSVCGKRVRRRDRKKIHLGVQLQFSKQLRVKHTTLADARQTAASPL